jgi:hypothetical protein
VAVCRPDVAPAAASNHAGADECTTSEGQLVARNRQPVDEILQFQRGRERASNEASYGFHGFPMHEQRPPTDRLDLHEPVGQRCPVHSYQSIEDALANRPRTKLEAFFLLCQGDDFARSLLYLQVPSHYTWQT